jgi:hypothetical protein
MCNTGSSKLYFMKVRECTRTFAYLWTFVRSKIDFWTFLFPKIDFWTFLFSKIDFWTFVHSKIHFINLNLILETKLENLC